MPGGLGRHKQFHPLLVRALDVLLAQVASVHQMLLDLARGPLFHLLSHRFAKIRTVVAFVAYLLPHHGPARGVGCQLHVDRGVIPRWAFSSAASPHRWCSPVA